MKRFKQHENTSLPIRAHKAYVKCIFRRRETQVEWETGLAILNPSWIGMAEIEDILDLNNKIVPKIWNYEIVNNSIIIDNHFVI